MIKVWGKFFRVQTFAATAMSPVLGAACAIGLDWRLLIVFVWGALVHLWGFGMNNWCDRFYDTGKQHSNPVSKGELNPDYALGAVVLIWCALWLAPLFFLETDVLTVYELMIFMVAVGGAYNLWSKDYLVLPGIWLGLWILFLTFTGYFFFVHEESTVIVLVALTAFMQLWCQWIEGLIKDRQTDPNNLAFVLKGWKWEGFFWGSKVAQVTVIDFLLWEFRPSLPYAILAFSLVMVSVLLWEFIGTEKDRAKMLSKSGAHEIIIFAAVVFCLEPILGAWSFVFVLVPAICYLVLNRLLYGAFGRPRV